MREGMPRGLLPCIRTSQLTMAMKKMDHLLLLNLMLTVRGEPLVARGNSREQEPVQVGSSLLEESCCKNHIKNL